MTEIRRGEIWVVNFDPTVGYEIRKTRPAVIIQNNLGNKYSGITIVAPLTSQGIEKICPVEVLLTFDNADVETDSKVLLNQIRAIDKIRLVKKIGTINLDAMEQINEALKISLVLDN